MGMLPVCRRPGLWTLIWVAAVLAGCGPRVDFDRLQSALGSADPGVQQSACTEVAALGSKGRVFTPDLVKLLEGKDPGSRRLAAYAVQEIGPEAREAIPALKQMLTETNRDLAVSAANTLAQIAPDAAPIEVGDVYWKRFEEPDPALPCYARAAALHPDDPVPYQRMAEVRRWLGQAEEAKKNQEMAERLAAGAGKPGPK